MSDENFDDCSADVGLRLGEERRRSALAMAINLLGTGAPHEDVLGAARAFEVFLSGREPQG